MTHQQLRLLGPDPSPVHANRMGQLGKNLGQIARNTSQNLLQDHTALKNNSLIVSTFILVLSRIIVANFSAQHAKGTPDGPLRYREAIRTTIREICGWTLGFMVLRAVQNLSKLGLKKYYQITDKPGRKVQSTPRELRTTISAAFKNKHYQVPTLGLTSWAPDTFEITNHQRAMNTRNWMGKFLPRIQHLSTTAFIEGLYHWAPLLIGSVPSVLLAGYALERYTRDHADEVVDTVSKKLSPQQQPTSQPAPPQNQQHFNNFVAKAQQEQSNRMGSGPL